ncbi:MAG TPA: hypothetical protein VGG20_09800 [Thermoanaerobaculia bacterium]|jgi:hypothetical protein
MKTTIDIPNDELQEAILSDTSAWIETLRPPRGASAAQPGLTAGLG